MAHGSARKRGIRGETQLVRKRINAELVKSLRPPQRELYLFDKEQPRFGIRLYPSGAKVYVVRLWRAGRQRWIRIGLHGDGWTADSARKEATRLLGVMADGGDPATERDLGKAMPTLAEFAERYLTDYAEAHKKPRTVIEERSLLGLRAAKKKVPADETASAKKPRTILAVLGPERLDAITAAHVTRFHLSWQRTPTRANRALALLSHMFTMAEKWGLRDPGSNPCRHVSRFRETKRERFLSAAELARLGDSLTEVERRSDQERRRRETQRKTKGRTGRKRGPKRPAAAKKKDKGKRIETVSPFGLAAIRLLVFTGARASEVLGLTWDSVDLEAGRARLPDSKTGAKTVFLPTPAVKVLKELPRLDGNPHVIPGGRKGQPLTLWGVEQVWQVIRREAGLADVRLHDLRHSFASIAAADGQSLPVIGALLGHSQAQTTKRYAHLSSDPLKAASDAIAGRLEAALGAGIKADK